MFLITWKKKNNKQQVTGFKFSKLSYDNWARFKFSKQLRNEIVMKPEVILWWLLVSICDGIWCIMGPKVVLWWFIVSICDDRWCFHHRNAVYSWPTSDSWCNCTDRHRYVTSMMKAWIVTSETSWISRFVVVNLGTWSIHSLLSCRAAP
jgi:hypothetical protein